jgi:hypothetical protein
MALASFNWAAATLATLAKLAPTSLSALIPAKLAAIPVVAGLAVGTAAGASFVTSPSFDPAAKAPQQLAAVSTAAVAPPAVAPVAIAPAAAVPAPVARPCETQTWPYLDAKCIAGTPQKKRVRFVNAPRPGEATPDEATDAKTQAPLTTRDTVLRQPQNLDAVPEAKPAPRAKRSDTRRKRDRRFTTQAYQVPNAYGETRPVIVVRPLRLDGR